MVFVPPATVLAWQRRRVRDHWARLSRRQPGRPAVSPALRALSRDLSTANPRGGAPRILGALRKLGSAGAKSTVEQYRLRPRQPPSPSWRAVRQNHRSALVALACFPVPPVRCKGLVGLLGLAPDRRRSLHCNGTAQPTAQGTAQPRVAAFPWNPAPRDLLRDREAVDGEGVDRRGAGLGLAPGLTAPRRPGQNPSAERVIGSIRRECRDPVIGFSAAHLRRLLARSVQ